MRFGPGLWKTCMLAAVLAQPICASAITRSWPGAAPCATTLQACIDGATDGDRIEISTATSVDENIDLAGRSLALTAPGTTAMATFAPGRSIEADTTSGSGVTLTLARLRLTDGHVHLRYAAAGTSTYNVSGLVIERGALGAASYLSVEAMTGTINATVTGNRISGIPGVGSVAGLIGFFTRGGTLNAYAAYNKVVRANQDTLEGAGILVESSEAGAPGAGYQRIFANEVRGDFNMGGIAFSEGEYSFNPSSYTARVFDNVVVCASGSTVGIDFTNRNGNADAQAINNTISRCHTGVGVYRWAGATVASTVSGYVSNNVISTATNGLYFTTDQTSGLANDYNLINAPFNTATLGAHTITTPARLVAAAAPRLALGSPGIDAADGNLLTNAILDAGLPTTDADGLRRFKGTKADIGAYESGDLSFEQVATAANTNGHITTLAQIGLNGASLLFPTRKAVAGTLDTYDDFGVWYSSSLHWTIYHEDTAVAVPAGKVWNVFAPASGGGGVFTQTATAANIGTWSMRIDNAATNGYADRIVLARHNFNLDGAYDNHPSAVYYDGSGSAGRWYIENADQAAMSIGAGFNVYAQPPSPNAFRLAAPFGQSILLIDHPLINHVACADVHVSRVVDPFTTPAATTDFTVEYDVGSSFADYWLVRSPVGFPANTSFNVVIDPAQVFACTDVIFANGFD